MALGSRYHCLAGVLVLCLTASAAAFGQIGDLKIVTRIGAVVYSCGHGVRPILSSSFTTLAVRTGECCCRLLGNDWEQEFVHLKKQGTAHLTATVRVHSYQRRRSTDRERDKFNLP